MLYLIGGTSRSGKSTITRRLLKDHGLMEIPLDVLMSSLIEADNIMGIDYTADSDVIAKTTWSLVKPLLENLHKHGGDYVVEGIMLWPSLIETLSPEIEHRSCFIGYQQIDSHVKLNQIRSDREQNWHDRNEFDDIELLRQIDNIKQISSRLEQACLDTGFTYLESSEDIDDLYQKVRKSLDIS